MQTITTKQIRSDLQGFLLRLQQGETFTVFYRSRPLVSVGPLPQEKSADKKKNLIPGSPEAVRDSLKLAKKMQSSATSVFDPARSFKELYSESLDEEYGIS